MKGILTKSEERARIKRESIMSEADHTINDFMNKCGYNYMDAKDATRKVFLDFLK